MNKTTDDKLLLIDENNLGKECVNLPTDYIRAAYNAAEKKKDIAEAEAELEVVRADVASRVRDTPAKFGLDPGSFRGGTITEAAIKEVLVTNAEVKEAEKSVRDARYEHDLAQSLVFAFDMKKRSLTNLVELHGMGYFSNVKASAKGVEAVRQSQPATRSYRREDRNDRH